MEMEPQKESPQKMAEEVQVSEYIAVINHQAIEQEFKNQYQIYCQKKIGKTICNKIYAIINRIVSNTVFFFHQFWKQIMPQIIRGEMKAFPPITLSQAQKNEAQLFEEYIRKRKPFFLIIYKSDCPQEQIQQAYINATNIVPEGFSIKYQQFLTTTNFQHWNIKKIKNQKYSIQFLKFDLFGVITWFGTLQERFVGLNEESSHFIVNFKRQVQIVIKEYQKAEMSFLGSYVEKEDRVSLDPAQEKEG